MKTIKSSEIGEYIYCSVSWYLRKCGFKPKSSHIKEGAKAHIDIGKKVATIQAKEISSKQQSYLGYILLAVAILGLIWLLI